MFALTDRIIADFLGKHPNASGRFYWEPEELPQIKAALRVLSKTAPEFLLDLTVRDRKFPNWMNLAIVDALAPKSVFFQAANYEEPIQIPHNTPTQFASGPVNFRVYEIPDYTYIQMFSTADMRPSECKDIIPQAVNSHKGIILDTRGPTWIGSSVAVAYSKHALWVACTQLDGDCVVVISNDRNVPVGTTIALEKLEVIYEKAAANISPRRGEIWRFYDTYPDGTSKWRPALIMSPDDRNANLVDVLLVPLTRKNSQPKYQLLVPKEVTGSECDSYANGSNIMRVHKDKLQKSGPIGHLDNPALMDEILFQIMQALGAK